MTAKLLTNQKDEAPKPDPNFFQRKVDEEFLKNEIGLHEASHFVFDCLGLMHVSNMTNIDHIIICAEKVYQDGYNKVNGFEPKISGNKLSINGQEPKGIQKFYEKNRKALCAKLLSRIAGNTSYLAFIKENESYYIGANPGNGNCHNNSYVFNYYSLTGIINTNFNPFPSSDFRYLISKLGIYYDIEGQERFEALNLMTEMTLELMKVDQIKSSILQIKEELLESHCKKIEGEQLEELVNSVQDDLKHVDYGSVLTKLENCLISNK